MAGSVRGAIAPFVVYCDDGSVNLDGTFQAMREAYLAECEASAVRDSQIESALDETFTSLGVDIYPTPETVSIASAMLAGGDLVKLAGIADEVREYLGRSTRFVGQRGRKGGLRRLK